MANTVIQMVFGTKWLIKVSEHCVWLEFAEDYLNEDGEGVQVSKSLMTQMSL
jgi:hypothetical protein